jgi:16S rRNA (cytidine1402-2'-O)-methyltransferase
MLYIVSTPIGNLSDITFRAIEILKKCDYILAEDTRRTIPLLKHYSIEKKVISFDEFREKRKTGDVVEDLKKGTEIVLVSDSGTPLISDPGFFLVRECVRNNISVVPVPGPSAAIAALSCSGLPADRFTFYGFIPKDNSKRNKLYQNIKEREETAILYESPHRIEKTIREISEKMPEKEIVIARELTKKFEEFIRGTPQQVLDIISKKKLKGEIVILIHYPLKTIPA